MRLGTSENWHVHVLVQKNILPSRWGTVCGTQPDFEPGFFEWEWDVSDYRPKEDIPELCLLCERIAFRIHA